MLTLLPLLQATTAEDADLLARNKDIADMLALISSYYTMSKDDNRARAFANASTQIAQYPEPIVSGTQAQLEIRGIGPSIGAAIDEYLNTGTIQRLHDLEKKFNERKEIIDHFMTFHGIGLVAAVRFYNQGLRNADDLWFKGNLTNAQKIGMMWKEHIDLRIPYEEMEIISSHIGAILDPYGLKWSIAGSYRRKEPSSGDVDLLVESKPGLDMNAVVSLLTPIIPAILAQGPSLTMGIIRVSEEYNGHRLDIRLFDPLAYPSALMYFTGSQRFNILMRNRANEFGLRLNEYGVLDERVIASYASQGITINTQRKAKERGEIEDIYEIFRIPEPINSEEDIFRILRVKYLAPEERTRTLTALVFV